MPDVPDLPPPAVPGSWAPPTPPTPTLGTAPPAPPAPTPPPPLDPGPEPPWWQRRVAALPIAAWIGLGAVAIGAIVAGAVVLGSDDDEPKLAIDVPPVTTAAPSPPRTTAAPTPSTGVAPTVPGSAPVTAPGSTPTSAPGSVPDTRPAVTGDGSDPEAPLPAADAASRFEYDDGLGAVWSGTVAGVVETPLWGDETGERCFVVLGTITPEAASGFVSDAWSTPYITLFVDGAEAELGDGSCEVEPLAEAGYTSLYDAYATVGTELAFYAEFSLPEAAGVPQAVAVSTTGNHDWRFFEAALLPDAPPVELGAVGPLSVAPTPVADGAPGAFSHRDDYTSDEWSGSILGLVEVDHDDSYDELDGHCYAVVGRLAADAVGSGITTTPYGAPPVHLVADGRLLDEYYGCASATAEEAGYAWFSDTEITAGTSLAVYTTVMVQAPFPGELQAIVVGDPWSDAPTLFAPFVLDGLPPATSEPGPPPPGPFAPAGSPVSVVDDYAETTWDVVVHGYVAAGDCVVVYAKATLTEGEPDQSVPYLSLVAGGHVVREDYLCDTTAATDAGYVELWEPDGQVGVPVNVFVAFRVDPALGAPQAIVVGGLGIVEPAAVTPVALPAAPPIPR